MNKKTWVYWVNILFLQFLFIRLYRAISDSGETISYGMLGFWLPLTGWSFDAVEFWRWSISFPTEAA